MHPSKTLEPDLSSMLGRPVLAAGVAAILTSPLKGKGWE